MTITDVVFPAFMFIVGIAIPLALASRLRRGHTRAAGAAARARPRGRAAGDGRPDGERGARRPGPAVAARRGSCVATAGVLLAVGRAGRGLGPRAPAAGCAPPAPRCSSSRRSRLPLARRGRLDPAAPALVGHPRPDRLGVPGGGGALPRRRRAPGGPHRPRGAPLLRRARPRDGRARALGGAAALRPAARHRRRDRALGHAAGSAAAAPPRGRARRLRPRRDRSSSRPLALAGVPRRGRAAAPHPERPRTPRSASQARRDRALGPALLGPHLPAPGCSSSWPPTSAAGGAGRGRSTIAGENPLVAYLLAPALFSLPTLAAPLTGGRDLYAAAREMPGIGLAVSAVFAWVVVWLTGLLRSRGLRVQL